VKYNSLILNVTSLCQAGDASKTAVATAELEPSLRVTGHHWLSNLGQVRSRVMLSYYLTLETRSGQAARSD